MHPSADGTSQRYILIEEHPMQSPQNRSQTSEVKGRRTKSRRQRTEVEDQRIVSSQELETLAREAYSRLIDIHGDLGISFDEFAEHLNSIAVRQTGAAAGESARRNLIAELISGDFLSDVYLTAACALKSNSAWERFFKLYSAHIEKVAHNVSRNHQQARDVFSDVIVHLFSPGSSGRSRIASYNGEGPLCTWLASIVKRLAINRSELRSEIESANSASLESLTRTPCTNAAASFDAALFSNKYSKAIEGAFRAAAATLNGRERLVLALRCDDDLRGEDIAATLGVHPAQISRVCRRAQLKFQTAALECLSTHYILSPAAIEECLAEMPHLSRRSIAAFFLNPGLRTSRPAERQTTHLKDPTIARQ